MERVLERIDRITCCAGQGNTFFSDDGMDAVNIDEKDFVYIEPRGSEKEFVYVDGGNNEIIGSSNFSVHLIRTAAVFIVNNQRKKIEQNTCYAVIESRQDDNRMYFEITILPINGIFLERKINISAAAMIAPNRRMQPVAVLGDLARRMCELMTAKELSGRLSHGSALVLDGSLSASYAEENTLMDEIKGIAQKKGILLCSLAKTSRIITKEGNNLVVMLARKAPEGMWYFRAKAKDSGSLTVIFTRLNSRAEHIFRYEMPEEMMAVDIVKVMGIMASNSTDPLFPGYPYGLILADRHARVPDEEKDIFRTKLLTKLGRRFESLRPFISSIDAHDRLDSINAWREI